MMIYTVHLGMRVDEVEAEVKADIQVEVEVEIARRTRKKQRKKVSKTYPHINKSCLKC